MQLFGGVIYAVSEDRLRAAGAESIREQGDAYSRLWSHLVLNQQNNKTELTFNLINVGIAMALQEWAECVHLCATCV